MRVLTLSIDEPEPWLVPQVADEIDNGRLVILPTDTGYCFCCRMDDKKVVERLYRVKQIDRKKPLSVFVADIQTAAAYTPGIANQAFRIIRRATPGPYTFILKASKQIPRLLQTKQKTIGIRIPNCPLVKALTEKLDVPILTSTVVIEVDEPSHDALVLAEAYRHDVDFLVDSGEVPVLPSTIISFTGLYPEVLREGAGSLDVLG